MKSYTDIEQSKKLAEILPIESADGTWKRVAIAGINLDIPEEPQYFHDGDTPFIYYSGIGIPSWSLAALLNAISYPTLAQDYNGKWSCMEFPGDEEVEGCENPVDACYEMIMESHEQKLL